MNPPFSILMVSMLLQAPFPAATEQERPLPERTNFLIEFQVKRRGINILGGPSDRYDLLSQYTYRDTVSEISLDSKGNPKETKKQVFERIPTRVNWYTYERQIVKNGVPLTAEELAKQDKKNEENVAKAEAQTQKQRDLALKRSANARKQFELSLARDLDKRGLTGEARKEEEEKQRKVFEDAEAGIRPASAPPPRMEDSSILQAADFQLVGREMIDGRSAIILTFKPNKGYKGGGNTEKILLQHAAGRIWVDENDYQMTKIEIEVTDSISLGLGLLAKIQPGSHAVAEWRKFNDEVWLPYRQIFTANGRLLLVKGIRFREVHEFSDYKKFVVSAEIKAEGR